MGRAPSLSPRARTQLLEQAQIAKDIIRSPTNDNGGSMHHFFTYFTAMLLEPLEAPYRLVLEASIVTKENAAELAEQDEAESAQTTIMARPYR